MNAPTFQTLLNLPQQRRKDARFGPVDELDDHSNIFTFSFSQPKCSVAIS